MHNLSDDLPSGPLLLALAAYHPIQKILQSGLRFISPGFYDTLAADRRQKLDPYFVFYAGLAITIFSTPYCIDAYRSTPIGDDVYGVNRTLTGPGQICLGSRAVLWISELPLLGYSSDFVLHHVLSLSALIGGLYRAAPVRPLYLIYAGLVTELMSDTICILRYHGWTVRNSRTLFGLVFTNAISLVVLRAIPALFCISVADLSPLTLNHWTWITPLLFYAGYMAFLSFKQLSSLGLIEFSSKRPANILIGRVTVPLFSIFFGTAITFTQLSTALIYAGSRNGVLSISEINNMSKASLESAAVGLFGARFIPTILGKVSPGDYPDPHGNCSKLGISIQGGILFTSFWAVVTPTLHAMSERAAMISSIAVSLLLGEAIGRLGCFSAGCCGGYSTAFPPQLLASMANIMAFTGILAAVSTGSLSLTAAGLLAMGYNGAVRIATNTLRKDSATAFRALAIMQTSVALFAIIARGSLDHIVSLTLAHPVFVLVTALFSFSAVPSLARAGTYALERLSSHTSWTLRPIILCSFAGVIMVSLAVLDTLRSGLSERSNEVPTVGEENMKNIITNMTLMTSITTAGLIPMIIRQGFFDRCS